MSTRRQEKVGAQIMREITDILRRHVSDPRVQEVHIVDVEVSSDFSFAKVLYSFLALDKTLTEEQIQAGLDSAKPFIRKELRKRLTLRCVPELAFFYDSSIKRGDKMLGLLRGITYSNASSEVDE